MALDQISAVTQADIIPVAKDIFFNSNPFLIHLMKNVTFTEGGTKIQQPLVTTNNSTATSYLGADVLPTAFDEETTSLEFNLAQYSVTISITGRDDALNNGPLGIINLVKLKVQVAEQSLRRQIGVDLQTDGTGNNSKNIVGLAAAVDDATNVGTYGNLSRTTYTGLKSQYSANGAVARAYTYNLLLTNFINASVDNERPTHLFVTPGGFGKWGQIAVPYTRIAQEDSAGRHNIGAPNLGFLGRPLIMDSNIQTTPVEKLWMLNMNTFHLHVHKDRFFRFVPFQTEARQDVAIAKILLMLQMLCDNPRLNSQITDLGSTL